MNGLMPFERTIKQTTEKKCPLAVKQQNCYTSVSSPSRHLSIGHKPYSSAGTQLTVRFYATTICFIFSFYLRLTDNNYKADILLSVRVSF